MKRIRLTVKNYRAFSDEEPMVIEIGSGFTALVGKNNSGKSAAKLFFYELRNLLTVLGQEFNVHPNLPDVLKREAAHEVQYLGITDVEEIFNNANTRPITVEFEILDPTTAIAGAEVLRRVVAVCDRKSPKKWFFKAYAQNQKKDILALHPNGNPGISTNTSLLFHPHVRIDCADFVASLRALGSARYYGPFRNAINQGSGEHFDLRVGTSFIELWNGWKTSGIRQQTRSIDFVTEDIRRLFEFERLEINASMSLNTLIVSIDGQPYRLSELGSGLAQFIIVLGNAATAPPSVLLIDEPETNLHPALQVDFLLSLARYSSEGVIFSTHSIGLARSTADRIYSVQKREGRTIVRPFEATPNYSEFVGELSFSTFKDLGSDKILLVEGVHDLKAIQQLLRMVRKEHKIVLLPLGGDELASGREAELQELRRISDNIFALVDSERERAGGPSKASREAFAETCKKLGYPVCVTERRALENYFSGRAIAAAFGEGFAALGPYQSLKESERPWRKADNWRIARQMEFSELEHTDLGKFLAAL